jgi:hypothetical protein
MARSNLLIPNYWHAPARLIQVQRRPHVEGVVDVGDRWGRLLYFAAVRGLAALKQADQVDRRREGRPVRHNDGHASATTTKPGKPA